MYLLKYQRALEDSDLPAPARHIASVLARNADNSTRKVHLTVAQIVKKTGWGRDAVIAHTKTLTKAGWLTQTHSGKGGHSVLANEYQYQIPMSATSTLTPDSNVGQDDGKVGQTDIAMSVSPDSMSARPTTSAFVSTSSSASQSSPAEQVSDDDTGEDTKEEEATARLEQLLSSSTSVIVDHVNNAIEFFWKTEGNFDPERALGKDHDQLLQRLGRWLSSEKFDMEDVMLGLFLGEGAEHNYRKIQFPAPFIGRQLKLLAEDHDRLITAAQRGSELFRRAGLELEDSE